jgi:hypothetical protein
MASIERRKTKDGKATRYRVKWRTGGNGAWDGVTFDLQAHAKRWKALVEAHGHQRPPVDQIGAHGFGYLVGGYQAVVDESTQLAGGHADEAVCASVTFEQYAREYIEGLVRPNRETKRKYLERLRLHAFPIIGQRPIAEITRRELRLWQAGLVEKGLSGKTIANIRGESIAPIFDAACLPGEDDEPPLRSYNPLRGLDLPAHVRPERDIVETEDEARIFIHAAYAVHPDAADLLVTLLASGARWGEGARSSGSGGAPRLGNDLRSTGRQAGVPDLGRGGEAEDPEGLSAGPRTRSGHGDAGTALSGPTSRRVRLYQPGRWFLAVRTVLRRALGEDPKTCRAPRAVEASDSARASAFAADVACQ